MPTQQQIKVVKDPVRKGHFSTTEEDNDVLDDVSLKDPSTISDGPGTLLLLQEEENHSTISMNTRSRTRQKIKSSTTTTTTTTRLRNVSHKPPKHKSSDIDKKEGLNCKTKQDEKNKKTKNTITGGSGSSSSSSRSSSTDKKSAFKTKTLKSKKKTVSKKFMQHELIKPLQKHITTPPEPVLSNINVGRRRIIFSAKQERKNLQQGKKINNGKIKQGIKSIHSQNKEHENTSNYSPSKGNHIVQMEVASKISEDTSHEKDGMDLKASHLKNATENRNKQNKLSTECHKRLMDPKKKGKVNYPKLPLNKNAGLSDQQTDQHNALHQIQTTDHFSSGSDTNSAMVENKSSLPIHLNPPVNNNDNNSVQPKVVTMYSIEQIEREKKYLEEYLNSKKAMSDNFVDIQPRPSGIETDHRTQALLMSRQSQRRSHTRGNYKCGFCGAMKKDHVCPTNLFVLDKAVQTDNQTITMTDKDKVIIVREIVKDCT